MKKIFVLSALAVGIVHADYKVTYPLDANYVKFKNEPITEIWVPGTSVLGAWTNKGTLFNCNIAPLVNGSFTHLKSCSQQQTQTVKTPETSNITHEVRYKDSLNEQTVTITENLTETWTDGTPILSTWIDKDEPYDCSSLPSVNDYSTGVSFTQTKTCSQNKSNR